MDKMKRIFVLDRGWVLVGDCTSPSDHMFWIELNNARCILEWGTTQSLEQLKNGPLPETRFGAVAETLRIPMRAVIYVIDCPNWKEQS